MTNPIQANAAQRLRRAVGLALLLTTPSLYLVEKYAGLRGIPVYVVAVAVAAWGWESGRALSLAGWIGERRARLLGLVSFLLLVALFAVVFPIANSGRFGAGSDGDEALNQAARAIASGRFPYHERTYLGNEITPMPGALFLAMPFVLLGNGAYQSLFWLGAGALSLWVCWRRESARTWLYCTLVVIGCPAVLHQLVTGTDYLANALMVLLPAVGLVTSAARGSGTAELGGLVVVFGLALSTRANYAFIAPLVMSRLWQTQRPRTAGIVSAGIVATAAAVTLPFFLYDPAGFSPLHTRRKLAHLNVVLPHADLILPTVALGLALALARRKWNGDTAAFLRNAALVEGLLFFVPALLHAFVDRTAPTIYTAFGTLFLPFGLAVYAAATARPASAG